MALNLSNRNDILLRIKQLSIQLKLMEKQNHPVECKHHFFDTNPDTKCKFCGKTILEVNDMELNKNERTSTS